MADQTQYPASASGSFAWFPALSDVIIAAYGRCQIRRGQLSVEHLQDAAMAANLLQVEWANEQVNLWTVELISTPLIAGQSTYPVDPATIMIMAAYITTGEMDVTADSTEPDADDLWPTVDGTFWTAQNDRIITGVDRDTFASYPDKHSLGTPTIYWFNQQVGPSIVLWKPPDRSRRWVLNYYRARELQDAKIENGILPDVPRHFLEAYVAALAFKLAELYAPARMAELLARAQSTFQRASQRDIEPFPLRIIPALGSYRDSVY